MTYEIKVTLQVSTGKTMTQAAAMVQDILTTDAHKTGISFESVDKVAEVKRK